MKKTFVTALALTGFLLTAHVSVHAQDVTATASPQASAVTQPASDSAADTSATVSAASGQASTGANAAPDLGQTTPGSHAILVDAQTGTILFEKGAGERMPTSSMSKTMTIYMVFDALKTGKIKLTDTFNVSEKAWAMQGSKMFVPLGAQVSVEDLIKGVVIQSGNDATIVLAEGLAGSEGAFVDAMNLRAKEIGMNDSNFMNASGWPDPNHYSTPRDFAILAYRLIKDYPEFYHYYAQTEFTYNNIHQRNRNPLLYRNIGADGIKTGHTEVAGYGLIGTAVQNGRRLILVVNGLSSEKQRSDEATRLLEWGFRNFENVTVANAGDTVETADVWLGQSPTVPLMLDHDIIATVYQPMKGQLQMKAVYDSPIAAPIKKGDTVAKLVVTMPGGVTQSHDLKAAEDVEKLGFFKKALAQAKYLVLGH